MFTKKELKYHQTFKRRFHFYVIYVNAEVFKLGSTKKFREKYCKKTVNNNKTKLFYVSLQCNYTCKY